MKIAIYCVNYHSQDRLVHYLESIDEAIQQTQGDLTLEVIVTDNSVPCETINYTPKAFALHVLASGENKGYFGAVKLGMEKFVPQGYDYVIISNVDVVVEKDFFTQLISAPISEDTGWIAPAILSQTHHFDFNPQAIKPYSLKKLKMLRLMFKYPILLKLKQKILHEYRDIKTVESEDIYAGHGSYIILTQAFFKCCDIIDYPIFLYGEEIFLAETCRQNNLKVKYLPQIKVQDIGKVSTGKFSFKTYCHYNYQAMDFLIKFFFHK